VVRLADAYREFIRLAGVTPPAPAPAPNPQPSTLNPQRPFDWPTCAAALTTEHQRKLAGWRSYSPKFVEWLRSENLLGLFDGERIAFPVHDAQGRVVGCHYRLKEDGSWRYSSTGTRTTPLIIGDIGQAQTIYPQKCVPSGRLAQIRL
jgi:hypothetical protein